MAHFKKANIDSIPVLSLEITLYEYLGKFSKFKALPEMGGEMPDKFYQNLFEQQKHNEGKEIRAKRYNNDSGDNRYLYWPYGDRIVGLARKYQSLPKRAREYILRCRESDVYWRGDEIDDFKTVVKLTLSHRKLSPLKKIEYRRSVMAQAKAITRAVRAN